jgi:hypothetical protein
MIMSMKHKQTLAIVNVSIPMIACQKKSNHIPSIVGRLPGAALWIVPESECREDPRPEDTGIRTCFSVEYLSVSLCYLRAAPHR